MAPNWSMGISSQYISLSSLRNRLLCAEMCILSCIPRMHMCMQIDLYDAGVSKHTEGRKVAEPRVGIRIRGGE